MGMVSHLFVFFFAATISDYYAVSAIDSPVVRTLYGRVEGVLLYIPNNDKPALTYLGVPFAAPPTGSNRFLPPQELTSWNGTLNAKLVGPACPQSMEYANFILKARNLDEYHTFQETSEDCLYLNIYTPELTSKHPVMVFIPGGGLVLGGAALYDSRAYAILKDVVVVVIQYRLGPLGFLGTGDDLVPGNMGFLDQVAALKWVQQNIINFGGDPNQVTIFGESAGSLSVHLHMLSPMSRGLFQRAIMQSGGITAIPFTQSREQQTSNARNFAQLLGCPTVNNTDMVECLRNLPADDLVNIQQVDWGTAIDGKFLADEPNTVQNRGGLKKDVDLIAGVCRTDGYMLGLAIYPQFAQPDFTEQAMKDLMKTILKTSYPSATENNLEEITRTALDVYAGDDTQKRFIDFFGDLVIVVPTQNASLAASDTTEGNVFFYEYDYRVSYSNNPEWVIGDHANDLFTTFGWTYQWLENGKRNPTDDDVKVDQLMLSYWSNFAKTGDPNGDGLPVWKSFRDGETYLKLKVSPEEAAVYHPERYKFWIETLPQIISPALNEDKDAAGKGTVHRSMDISLVCSAAVLTMLYAMC